ncbi:hypothetical protein CHU98_g12065 [Xylaria longipes]|nr:hypothetical protein CHU98_g12065 [Xylaria longipes]
MDAFSSVIAVVMVAVTSVSVGSIAKGKCHGSQYKFVTRGLCGGGTKDVRGVPKRHKANVGSSGASQVMSTILGMADSKWDGSASGAWICYEQNRLFALRKGIMIPRLACSSLKISYRK